jgi:chromosome segregation ATPase
VYDRLDPHDEIAKLRDENQELKSASRKCTKSSSENSSFKKSHETFKREVENLQNEKGKFNAIIVEQKSKISKMEDEVFVESGSAALFEEIDSELQELRDKLQQTEIVQAKVLDNIEQEVNELKQKLEIENQNADSFSEKQLASDKLKQEQDSALFSLTEELNTVKKQLTQTQEDYTPWHALAVARGRRHLRARETETFR